MNSARIMERQTLLDVAVMCCGGVEAAYELALANGRALTADVAPGTLLGLPGVVNRAVVERYRARGLQPATGLANQGGEGIDFWGIERTFVVN